MEKKVKRELKSVMVTVETHRKLAQYTLDNGGNIGITTDKAIDMLIESDKLVEDNIVDELE